RQSKKAPEHTQSHKDIVWNDAEPTTHGHTPLWWGALLAPLIGFPPLPLWLPCWLGRGWPQGDRTILTRLPFLAHSVSSVAPTKPPHERRRAQTHSLRHGYAHTPPWWGRLPGLQCEGTSLRSWLQPSRIGRSASGSIDIQVCFWKSRQPV